MNCDNCGAPMKPVDGRNYLACGHCHTFRFPTPLEGSPDRLTPLAAEADVDCPVCGVRLAVGSLDQVRIRYCDRCRGVLILNDAFAHVVHERRGRYTGVDEPQVPIDPRQYERGLACPSCSGPMEVHPYLGPGHVVIDSCVRCHLVWLDPSEAATIERAPGRRAPAAPPFKPSLPPPTPDSPSSRALDLFAILFGRRGA